MGEVQGFIPAQEFQTPPDMVDADLSEHENKAESVMWPAERVTEFNNRLELPDGSIESVEEYAIEGIEKHGITINLNPEVHIQLPLIFHRLRYAENAKVEILLSENPFIVINNAGSEGIDLNGRNMVPPGNDEQSFHVDNDGSGMEKRHYSTFYMLDNVNMVRPNPTNFAPAEQVKAADKRARMEWIINLRKSPNYTPNHTRAQFVDFLHKLDTSSTGVDFATLMSDPERYLEQFLQSVEDIDFPHLSREDKQFKEVRQRIRQLLWPLVRSHFYRPGQAILVDEALFWHARGGNPGTRQGGTPPVTFDPGSMDDIALEHQRNLASRERRAAAVAA